jgi:hypothetical protein
VGERVLSPEDAGCRLGPKVVCRIEGLDHHHGGRCGSGEAGQDRIHAFRREVLQHPAVGEEGCSRLRVGGDPVCTVGLHEGRAPVGAEAGARARQRHLVEVEAHGSHRVGRGPHDVLENEGVAAADLDEAAITAARKEVRQRIDRRAVCVERQAQAGFVVGDVEAVAEGAPPDGGKRGLYLFRPAGALGAVHTGCKDRGLHPGEAVGVRPGLDLPGHLREQEFGRAPHGALQCVAQHVRPSVPSASVPTAPLRSSPWSVAAGRVGAR